MAGVQVLTATQARAAGLSSAAVRWRLRTGRWQELYPRVYWTATGPVPLLVACRAALLYAGAGAVLSHDTAAALHGLAGADLVPVHVTIPAARRVRARPGIRIHRSVLDGRHATRRGLVMHQIERAVLDMAVLRPRRAAAVLAAAVQEGLTTPDRLRACHAALPHNRLGHRATGRLLDDVAGGTRSELEGLCLRAVRRAGLREPARDFALVLPDRTVRLDLCYPGARVAVEIDGRSFHLGAESWARDLDRQNALVQAGWLVLRFTGSDVRCRPDHVVAQIGAALTARAA